MTWLDVAPDDLWGVDNLPYGSVTGHDGRRFAAVRIGDYALDLSAAPSTWSALFEDGMLDSFLAAGPPTYATVRRDVTTWLTDPSNRPIVEPLLRPLDTVTSNFGFAVADYVDFYASESHASNVGRMFRPREEPLTPNWRHLPIGYHGRAGTVVVSGTDVARPSGQLGPGVFGPTSRLDFEAEVSFVVGVGSAPSTPVPTEDFDEHVFGVAILNDWSARDIQAWEYRPLGPMLGKSFATSMSAWITPLAALAHAWVDPPEQDPEPLPYLRGGQALDLTLAVSINGTPVATLPFRQMYWTPAQMLAHLTVNGARLRTGDVFASGTVSGPGKDERGCLLELTWNGAEPITLADGTTRTFLADGDDVRIAAVAPGPHGPIGLAEVRGRVRAAV